MTIRIGASAAALTVMLNANVKLKYNFAKTPLNRAPRYKTNLYRRKSWCRNKSWCRKKTLNEKVRA